MNIFEAQDTLIEAERTLQKEIEDFFTPRVDMTKTLQTGDVKYVKSPGPKRVDDSLIVRSMIGNHKTYDDALIIKQKRAKRRMTVKMQNGNQQRRRGGNMGKMQSHMSGSPSPNSGTSSFGGLSRALQFQGRKKHEEIKYQ